MESVLLRRVTDFQLKRNSKEAYSKSRVGFCFFGEPGRGAEKSNIKF
jgi:hypothetical protein